MSLIIRRGLIATVVLFIALAALRAQEPPVMTPMQAIQAVTVNAADLLGWTDRVALERVGFVMKGGVVVAPWPDWSPARIGSSIRRLIP